MKTPLSTLQTLCASWPEVKETTTYGHPTFQVRKRTFAVLDDHEQPGLMCLVVKLGIERQAELVDGTVFFRSKFGAKHGWTAMKIDRQTDWKLAAALMAESYQRVGGKPAVAKAA